MNHLTSATVERQLPDYGVKMVYIPGGFSMLECSMRRVEEKIVWCAFHDVVLHVPPLTHHLNGGVDTSYLLSLFLTLKSVLW